MRDESTLPVVLRKTLPPNLEKIRQGHYTEDDYDYPIHLYLKENDIRVDETGSDIINFLKGKSIFITGATGFLGKLLVEKLLRCCKDIGTIYLLVRAKKGKTPEERIQEYLENWVFVRLSDIHPNFKDKVVGVSGDAEQEGFGLSQESRQMLIEKVNIIYHVAATVRFDEKLKKSVTVNIKGTQAIIKLAKECKKLDVLTHVSTAFANCHNKEIAEKFYSPIMDPYELIGMTDTMSDEIIEKITPGLMGTCPNSYVFTKQIAEHIVKTESIGIPTCIQRPSIVIASVKEPVRSWVDNIFGPVGLVEAAVLGLLHVMLGNSKGKCDMVPVDYVVNNCIAASYKTAKDRLTDRVQIFNYTSSDVNSIQWKNLGLAAKQGVKVGSTKALVLGFFRFTTSHYWYLFLNFILHTVPGHVVDFITVRLGKKPQLISAYSKINRYVTFLSHFTLNEWEFNSTNSKNLWKSLNEKDKINFKFDLETLNWMNYFDTYLITMREFLLFEFLDNLEEGRTAMNRMIAASYFAFFLTLTVPAYFLLNTAFCFIPITIFVIVAFYLLTDDM